MPPGADFYDDGKSQQTNPLKSLHLLYGVGLQRIHGFLRQWFWGDSGELTAGQETQNKYIKINILHEK